LKPDGIMTLMFTHKATGAWDALTKGLMEAGFAITASWPINTEAEGSLHIKDKSAANSTIFLVCRPLRSRVPTPATGKTWNRKVRAAVRNRIGVFQTAGIRGVDLYLSCFGPALEVFSQAWPLVRGTPRQDIEQSRRKRRRRNVRRGLRPLRRHAGRRTRRGTHRGEAMAALKQLAHVRRNVELDNLTSWFVLAWDAFEAPVFPFDEANKLAKVCGVDLDRDVVGRLAEKKGAPTSSSGTASPVPPRARSACPMVATR
jgi:putative DNA methylase